MATLTEILDEVKRLRSAVESLPGRINVSAAQVVVTTGLSDISEKLGLIQAGEFRTGNRVSPGDGFSGVRIGYPGFSYGGAIYNIVGVDADTLMFGLRSSDGAAIAGGGNVTIGAGGITVENNVTAVTWLGASSTTDGWFAFVDSNNSFSIASGMSGARTDMVFDLTNSSGAVFRAVIQDSTGATPNLTFSEDASARMQLDLGLSESGGKFTIGGEVEIHGQGDTFGQTFLLLNASSDTPSTSDPSLAALEVRMYYRAGNLVFQVFSTGDSDEDRYFYARMSGTDASSDWTISTDPV